MAGSFMSFQKPRCRSRSEPCTGCRTSPGLRVQHVGEVAPPRPDGSLKIGSVGPLAEVALFLALVADRIACFLLDAGVDDGHQRTLLFHLGYKAGKIGEILRVDGEVLVVVHVVDVHVHHVQGNVGLAVFGHHLFKSAWVL